MVGAVGMALAIEYDRTGVLTFLIPGVIGIFILIGSWVNFMPKSTKKYFFFCRYDSIFE
jgi:hypothetical protein